MLFDLRQKLRQSGHRARVEQPISIIKGQFGFTKARYRSLTKNASKLAMLFTLANVVRGDQRLRA